MKTLKLEPTTGWRIKPNDENVIIVKAPFSTSSENVQDCCHAVQEYDNGNFRLMLQHFNIVYSGEGFEASRPLVLSVNVNSAQAESDCACEIFQLWRVDSSIHRDTERLELA